eukprot:3454568-Rhodomonas_salina.1
MRGWNRDASSSFVMTSKSRKVVLTPAVKFSDKSQTVYRKFCAFLATRANVSDSREGTEGNPS